LTERTVRDEEIIDLQADENGTYHPVAVIRKSPQYIERRGQKIPVFYQVLDGFVVGLGAFERFLDKLNATRELQMKNRSKVPKKKKRKY